MSEYTAAIKASYILMFFLFLFLHVFTNLYGGHGKYLIGAWIHGSIDCIFCLMWSDYLMCFFECGACVPVRTNVRALG